MNNWESGWSVYGSSLYYYYNFSVNLKWFQNKKLKNGCNFRKRVIFHIKYQRAQRLALVFFNFIMANFNFQNYCKFHIYNSVKYFSIKLYKIRTLKKIPMLLLYL